MSFSFSAIGTKDQVLAQLRSHHGAGDHQLAALTRQLVTDALDSDISSIESSGWGYSYVVKASGHAGSPASLSLEIEAVWVPRIVDVVDVPLAQPTAEQLAEEDRARYDAAPQEFKDGLQEIDQHVRTREEAGGR